MGGLRGIDSAREISSAKGRKEGGREGGQRTDRATLP